MLYHFPFSHNYIGSFATTNFLVTPFRPFNRSTRFELLSHRHPLPPNTKRLLILTQPIQTPTTEMVLLTKAQASRN
jgi:hypothetical protein